MCAFIVEVERRVRKLWVTQEIIIEVDGRMSTTKKEGGTTED
jgi:hypothetical protein